MKTGVIDWCWKMTKLRHDQIVLCDSEKNIRTSGLYLLPKESFIEANKEDNEFLTESTTVSLVASAEQLSRKINTTWLIIVHLFISIAMWICVFVLPVVCPDKKCGIPSLSLIIYMMGGVWFIQLLIDRYYRNQHYRSRLYGYLNFYRRTRNIRRITLIMASAAVTIMLIVSQILSDKCPTAKDGKCGSLTADNYMQIIVSISCAGQLLTLVVYLVQTIDFNRSGAPPDVNQEEMVTSFLQTNSVSSDIGFRDGGLQDEVLDRQADMIRYLKQHNEQLSKKLLTLSEENQMLKQRGVGLS